MNFPYSSSKSCSRYFIAGGFGMMITKLKLFVVTYPLKYKYQKKPHLFIKLQMWITAVKALVQCTLYTLHWLPPDVGPTPKP